MLSIIGAKNAPEHDGGGVQHAAYYQPKKRQRKKGARLPQENGHQKRRKGPGPPQSQGQSQTELLIQSFAALGLGA
jgi:hypothetical protein